MIFIHIFGECPVKLRKSELDTGRIYDPNGWIHWKYCSVAKEGFNPGVRPEAEKGAGGRHLGGLFHFLGVNFWEMIGLVVFFSN